MVHTVRSGGQAASAQAVIDLRKAFSDGAVPEAEWQETGPVRVQVFDPDGYRVETYAWD